MGYWFSEASLTAHIQVYRRRRVFVFRPGRWLQQSVAASVRGNKAATSAASFRSLLGGRRSQPTILSIVSFPFTRLVKRKKKYSWNLRLWMVGGNAAVLFVVYRSVCLAADSCFCRNGKGTKLTKSVRSLLQWPWASAEKHHGGLQCQSMKSSDSRQSRPCWTGM